MSDLPESVQNTRRKALLHAFFNEPLQIAERPTEGEELRIQQYAAAQAFHIRRALERIAVALERGEDRESKSLFVPTS